MAPDSSPAAPPRQEVSPEVAAERGRVLLALAREAIAAAVGAPAAAQPATPPNTGRVPAVRLSEPWLRAPGACFVTLTLEGRLRGCIGSIKARRALVEDVRSNARAAALADPRFPPIAAAELAATRIEVSLLSAATPLPAATEAEALAALRPGVDGLILEYDYDAQATFLPQVWETLPAPRDFLAHLKHKAGLPPDFWSPAIRLQRYGVTRWAEPEGGKA